MPKTRVIAVDFDGTICTIAPFPEIGEPNWEVIHTLKALQEAEGAKLILWTCRTNEALKMAVDACREWGLTFDAINESLPEWRERWGNDPRKIGASEYWDDRAVTVKACSLAGDVRTSLKSLKPGDTAFVLSRKEYVSHGPIVYSERTVSKVGREYLYLARYENDPDPDKFSLATGIYNRDWDGLHHEAFATRDEAKRAERWWNLYSQVCYKPMQSALKYSTVEELEQVKMIIDRCFRRGLRAEADAERKELLQ